MEEQQSDMAVTHDEVSETASKPSQTEPSPMVESMYILETDRKDSSIAKCSAIPPISDNQVFSGIKVSLTFHPLRFGQQLRSQNIAINHILPNISAARLSRCPTNFLPQPGTRAQSWTSTETATVKDGRPVDVGAASASRPRISNTPSAT